jgi:DMSO/TMAO reductase YedYZ heme-binding membrane subunit
MTLEERNSSQRRENLWFAGAWLATAAHIAQAVISGPQQVGERPLASPSVWAANFIGFWALVWLIAALACTPIRVHLKANWPARWRKRLGLSSALLAGIHVAVWAVGEGSMEHIFKEFAKHPWLWPGLIALVGLGVLAATSTTAAVKKLGGQRWRLLHRSVYVWAVMIVLHYALRQTADVQHLWPGRGAGAGGAAHGPVAVNLGNALPCPGVGRDGHRSAKPCSPLENSDGSS